MVDPRDIERTGLFVGLAEQHRGEALAAFRTFKVGAREDLLAEGEPDRSMLVVIEGELSVTLGGVELARLGRSETAGEMTLFGSFDRRAATVTTLTPASLLLLDEQGVKYLRVQNNPLARTLEIRALRTIAKRLRDTNGAIADLAPGQPVEPVRTRGLFGRLATALGVGGDLPRRGAPRALDVLRATPGFMGRDDEVLQNLAARLEVIAVPMGETVIAEGQKGDDAYIVAEGKVGVYCTLTMGRVERVAILGAGHAFGQVALGDTRARSATCRAVEPLYLLRIPGDVYRTFEGEHTREGRMFRRGMIDGLSVQLRLANEHLLSLKGRHAGE